MCLAIVKTKFNDTSSITNSTRLRDVVAHKIIPMSNAVHMMKTTSIPINTNTSTPINANANANANANITSTNINNSNTITSGISSGSTKNSNDNNMPSRLLARMKSNLDSNNDSNNDMKIETHIPMMNNTNMNNDTNPIIQDSQLRDITNSKIATPKRPAPIPMIATTATTPTLKVLTKHFNKVLSLILTNSSMCRPLIR